MSIPASEFVASGQYVASWTTGVGIPSYELFEPPGPSRIDLSGVVGDVDETGDFVAANRGRVIADGQRLRTLRISHVMPIPK